MKLEYIAVLLAAYLLGSVPFGFLAARLIKGVDIRKVGSGNIGATNAARVLGWRCFPVIFLLDMLKGLLPVLLMRRLVSAEPTPPAWSPSPLVVGAGLCAILGHVFPVFLRFKGGKAVATSTGVFLMLDPVVTLVVFAIWLTVFLLSRYVSLASVCAAAAMPLLFSFWRSPEPLGKGIFLTVFCWFGAIFVIILHKANIKRLMSGTEHRAGKNEHAG